MDVIRALSRRQKFHPYSPCTLSLLPVLFLLLRTHPPGQLGATSSSSAPLVYHWRVAVTSAAPLLRTRPGTVTVFTRQINYLTNNCSHRVLYVLVVNFTSKRLAGRIHRPPACPARRMLFVNSIKPLPPLPIFLEEVAGGGFYDRRKPSRGREQCVRAR